MRVASEELSALMRAANRGDASAYRRVLEALTELLRAIAVRGLARAGQGGADAEDIVQDTLLAIHLKRHTWDESQPLLPWVRAIAHHKLIDGLRRRGFRQHLPIDDLSDVLEAPQTSAEFSGAECAKALSGLPERQREVVVGMSVEGRSARELGERLGMTEGAVRVMLHRALKALAGSLGGGREGHTS